MVMGDKNIDSPLNLEGVSNEKLFAKVIENVKEWYGNNFTDEENEEIKVKWNEGCRDFHDKSDDFKKAVIGNRIDKYLFESRNKDYRGIDEKIIRTMKNTSMQRKFREIALELKKILNVSEFSRDEILVIQSEFLKAKNNGKLPDIDKIIKLLETAQYGIPSDEILNNNQNIMSQGLQNFGNIIINGKVLPDDISNDKKKQITTNISMINNLFKDVIDPDDYETNQILLEVCCSSGDGDLITNTCGVLIEKNPAILGKLFGNIDVTDVNDSDLSRDDEWEEETEEYKKDIEYLVKEWGYSEKYAKQVKAKYDGILNKINNNIKLTKQETADYTKLCILFGKEGKGGVLRQARKLKEIRDLQIAQAREFKAMTMKSSKEYATGNIKGIKPMAIIENNNQIKNYIYGKKEIRENLDINSINLSINETIKLFDKLKKQKKGDKIFLESIKYLNKDLTINENLVDSSGVDMQSVVDNQKKIENMIKELAVQENLDKYDKKTINDINIKKSAMLCCFRAISSFFDTVNNNGENFASEFEIADINKNIEFNEDTGVITMSGTIGANKNHIKLYYHTKSGKLEFDDFLAYDDKEHCYKIGKGNGKREEIKEIKLPTMDKMEEVAKYTGLISHNLIDKLSFNNRQYDHTIGFAMTESIWLNCFRGLMGNNMKVGSTFVEKFNEKNILKQDIIKNIYKKFYNENSLDDYLYNDTKYLEISKGNKPEQFKLIELIYNSIKHYDSTDKLLAFRNYVNKLDNLLSSKDTIKKDGILTEFFGDDLSNDNDAHDNTIEKIKQENGFIINNNESNTYKFNGNNQRPGGHGLNYYNFLDLIATEDTGGEKFIDLHEFKNILDIIGKDDCNLANNSSTTFRENYENYMREQDLGNLERQMNNAYPC